MTERVPAAASALLGRGRCWGLELEPRWRVLGVTFEPPGGGDLLQLLCSPVSTFLVLLTREVAGRPTIVTFDAAQLPAVGTRLGGAVVGPEPFGAPEPRPGAWGPQWSLQGRSSAADGIRTTLTLDLQEDDARLRLFARFDAIEVRDAAGALRLAWPTEAAQGGGASAGTSSPADRGAGEEPRQF